MLKPLKAYAFDLDQDSLASLRVALPAWDVEEISGATAASLANDWIPGTADLLVLGFRDNGRETLGLCRFLAFRSSNSKDSLPAPKEPFLLSEQHQRQARRTDAAVLVLVPAGQEPFIESVLQAGAHSCLLMPIHAKDIASMFVHALAGNQPGRHTLGLEGAQSEDRWRDDGGQG